MRAARLHKIGGTPQVDELEQPGADASLSVGLAALNPVDISIGDGRFYGGHPPTPYVIGSEAVGVTSDGRRVWTRGGSLMAQRAAPGSWVFAIPDGLSDELALGCGIAGLTAWLALSWRAPVLASDTVLVLGATGVVGATAVQAAKLLGAERVIGAARQPAGAPECADAVVALGDGSELPAATLIVDALWGEPFERALAAAASGVRVVHLGQAAAPAATLQSAWVRGKQATILGLALFETPSEVAEEAYTTLCGHALAGRIGFRSELYPLAEVANAWARQAGGTGGVKVLVSLAD